MNDPSFQSLKIQNDSENEFFDAYETMEHKTGINLKQKTEKNENVSDLEEKFEKAKIEEFSDSDDDEHQFHTMKTDFKYFESKEFVDRHNNLTKTKDETKNEKDNEDINKKGVDNDESDNGEKFVPLNEKLNNELKESGLKRNESDDEENDEEKINDPFYINEEELEKEFAELNENELEEKFKSAKDFKAEGNKLFQEEKYMEALEEYTKSLRSCPILFNKDRAIFHSNRSICYFKMKNDLKCIAECSKAIELNPNFIKPLLRRAECNQTLDKLDEVLNDYKKLCELDPSNISYKRKFIELEQSIKERNEKLKDEMMGKLKDLGNMCLKPFGLSTNNFNFVQDPSTGSYSVNFNQN